ncbi:protein HIRA-like isoform X2 [Hydractinia symbiolongicarpus]|uniref:protein HIRA-like isoform X2 n=1 Tax=Hydractinia symbiolongicarpus TaxID=13093 RepID=UPI00254FE121|nr:protein HIRA-like isoform X2 [Hydractinia symbiolongicarpus]
MKLLKPDWVNHNGKAIFAVDIHPDGRRFATGGQGEDTGMIVIWNMPPVVSEKHEVNENVPKMLCQMDEHTACVNCLRWSNSGKFLASGGDDKIIMLWGLSRASGSTVFGTGGVVVNIENWKCAHILRGHSGDILDIAWSPDDSYIATGSVDNTIIVWNAQKFPEIVHTIKEHHGLVKGVTFDPVGKYLASQSDDKSLCIWNTSDWKLEKKITEPFLESSGTTHALRLNWSPDGHYVVSAHAMNNGGPVAKIVERNGWKTRMDFVGHRKAITCVRFNDRLFSGKNEASKPQYVCCAVGSRDRSLSVWITSLQRPLVVIHELFENSVMDISWSQCGYFLIACSLDGTVAYMDFSQEELGKVMSPEDKYIYHKKTYGTSIKTSKSLILSSVVENPEFLKHQQQQQHEEHVKKTELLQQKFMSSAAAISPGGKFASTPFKAGDGKHSGGLISTSSNDKFQFDQILKKQKECKTADGKRRIVPMMLEAPPEFGADNEALVDFNAESNKSLISQEQNILSTPAKQLMFSSPLKDNTIKTQATTSGSSTTTTTTTTTTANLAVKRKADVTDTPPTKKQKKKKNKEGDKMSKNDLLNTPLKTQNNANVGETEQQRMNSLIQIPFPEPEQRLCLQVNLSSSKQSDTTARLEVENDLEASGTAFHYLRCVVEDNLSWETCLSNPINAIAANTLIVCASCRNNTVHCFSTKGRRLLPPLVVNGHVSQLQCHGRHVMVLTSTGNISVWDMKNLKAVIRSESLIPILKDANQSISHSFVNENGFPVVTLSNHSVYMFDQSLASWVLLAGACDSLQLSADLGSCSTGAQPKGPLHSVQAPLSRMSKQMIRGLRLNPTKQQTNTFSYLESQVCAALSINSPEEYHFWLMTYARYIVQSNEESRLRELCEDLLGPVIFTKKASSWQPKILCYDKRDLLKDMLPILASNLRFQRFYSEFQQQLETLTKR